ncbi:MAG: DUF4124 domain-containing protein [Marinagarivorans sp.]
MLRLLLLTCLIALATSAQAEIKKWQDEKGRWHFADDPAAKLNARQNNSASEPTAQNKETNQPPETKTSNAIALNKTAHGNYYLYKGRNAARTLKILVLAHGMFSERKTEFIAAQQMLEPWINFADEQGLTLVAPVFDNAAFAVTQKASGDGGYRGLFGRDMPADEYLHEIIAEFQSRNQEYDGRFYLVGHSAGAQFANRYLIRHASRVIAATYSAPAWLAFPDKNLKWPLGMGRRTYSQNWEGRSVDQKFDIQPSPDWWLSAAAVPSLLIVGDQDTTPIRHVDNIGGDNHVLRAQFWVSSMQEFAKNSGVRCNAQFKLVPNVGHDYKKLVPDMQQFIKSYL